MTRLESTKNINNLKAKAIKKGGYKKFESIIISACKEHFNKFGIDLTPNHF